MPTTVAQRNAALERANRYRAIQKMFKQNVGALSMDAGLLMVREVIADPPTELAGMRAEKTLMAVRAVGLDKAAAILRKAHISSQRKLRDLTDNERARLDVALR